MKNLLDWLKLSGYLIILFVVGMLSKKDLLMVLTFNMLNSKYYIKFDNRCLTQREVYNFFENIYPNCSVYRHISYSNQTIKLIKKICNQHVSTNRIISIEYLSISKYFEIYYYKRHYKNKGVILIRL